MDYSTKISKQCEDRNLTYKAKDDFCLIILFIDQKDFRPNYPENVLLPHKFGFLQKRIGCIFRWEVIVIIEYKMKIFISWAIQDLIFPALLFIINYLLNGLFNEQEAIDSVVHARMIVSWLPWKSTFDGVVIQRTSFLK